MSGNVEFSLEKTAEIISSISRTFSSESSKMKESVFLTTSVVFLEQSSKYIDISLEALAEAFSPTVLIFFHWESENMQKVRNFTKSVSLLITLHWHSEYSFGNPVEKLRRKAEGSSVSAKITKLHNFKKKFFHKMFCWVSRSIFWDSCSKVSAQGRRTDNSMSKKSEKKTYFSRKIFRAKFSSGNVELFLKKTAEFFSSISRTFSSES